MIKLTIFTPTKPLPFCLCLLLGIFLFQPFTTAQSFKPKPQQKHLSTTDINPCGTHPTQADIERLTGLQKEYIAFQHAFTPFQLARKNESVLVPIQIHIIRNGDGTGGTDYQDILEEMDRTNALYRNAGLQFAEIAPPNYVDSDTWVEFDAAFENTLLNRVYVDGAINIYFFEALFSGDSELCGYTYFPGSVSRDFIMMSGRCVTGFTLAHEIGHYFALYHTHGKSNCGTTDELVNGFRCEITGDDVCDTPADPNLFFNCEEGLVNNNCEYTGTLRDANGDLYQPDVSNIMSYSRSACRDIFSPGQYARMRFTYENDRSYLIYDQDTSACPAPAITFTTSLESDSTVLNWSSTEADKYQVEYKSSMDSLWIVLPTITEGSTSVLLSNLEDCTDYQFRVKSICSDTLESAYSRVRSFTTSNCPCTISSNLSTPIVTERAAIMSWSGNIAVDEAYDVQVRVADGGDWFTFTAEDTSLTLIYFVPCTTYEFRVKPICIEDFSEAFAFTTLGCSEYCLAYGFTESAYINRVTLEQIDNVSGDNLGYADFTNLIDTVAVGESYALELEPGFFEANARVYWRIDIDFNQDNDFEDSGESVVRTFSASGNTQFLGFRVAPDALAGDTRMRITMSDQFATACGEVDDGEVEDYTLHILPPAISISSTFEAVETEGDTLKLDLTSSESWSITASEEWIEINPSNGVGDSTIEVIVAPNPTFFARSGNITYTTENGVEVSTIISQSAKDFRLTFEPSILRIPNEGGVDTVQLNSNIAWEIENNADWLSISPTKDSADAQIVITSTKNESRFDRSVNIIAGQGGLTSSLFIVQDGEGDVIEILPDTLFFDEKAGVQTIDISANLRWFVRNTSSIPNWISLSDNSEFGDAEIEVSITALPETESARQTIIEIGGGNATQFLTVIQELSIPSTIIPSAKMTALAGVFLGEILIEGEPASSRDLIIAYDTARNVAGLAPVTKFEGKSFINLIIYGDDPATIEDEGINEGEAFTLAVFDYSRDSILDYTDENGIVFFTEWQDNFGAPIPAYDNSETIYDFGFENEITSDVIYLNAGWNLISIDLIPEQDSIDFVFSTLRQGNLDLVSGYERGAVLYDPSQEPGLNTLNTIKKGAGYWVRVDEADTLMVTGIRIAPTFRLPLQNGWNLMGYMPDETQAVADYLADVIADGELNVISSFDGGYIFYDPKGAAFLNTLDSLRNSFGYWVQLFSVSSDRKNLDKLTNQFMFVGGKVNNWTAEGTGHIEIVNQAGQSLSSVEILPNGILKPTPIYGQVALEGIADNPVPGEELFLKWNNQILDQSFTFNPTVGIEKLELDLLAVNQILTAYPNPFNKNIAINYVMTQTGNAFIRLINSNGQVADQLDLGTQEAGNYQTDWIPQNIAEGTYWLQLWIDGVPKKQIPIIHLR